MAECLILLLLFGSDLLWFPIAHHAGAAPRMSKDASSLTRTVTIAELRNIEVDIPATTETPKVFESGVYRRQTGNCITARPSSSTTAPAPRHSCPKTFPLTA